ncbi:MAG: methyl-accepting chemotaxis protein [Pyrinomonadaceae bacterium]|nr:methyl-accepting chemotaxis protein [Pyrinomonadaceae bacterium]MCX7639058.1 methyl-accepting chemotaxis protein [Pyrinomonadaceae bacterium]MDW8303721.1 methyl-accepting chemotaxis protein [Acidobacteriota bacterium]
MTKLLHNFLIRISSAVAIVFLVLGLIFILVSYFADEPSSFVGLVIMTFAVLVAILAIVMANFAIFNLSSEIRESAFLAEKIAQGELFSDSEESVSSEVKSALRLVEANFSQRMREIERAASGDFDFEINLFSDSDVFGQSLQRLIVRLKSSVLTKEYKENLNKSIQSFLTKSSQIMNGDYAVKVAAFLPEMEPAARAFNSMVYSLNQLISQVKRINEESLFSARRVNDLLERLDRENELQTEQISQTSTKLTQMLSQVQKISEICQKVVLLSESLQIFSQSAAKTLEEESKVTNALRRQSQETAKRLKKLGEYSQEVYQQVSTMIELRDRVSLLLLNAKIYSSSVHSFEARGMFLIQEIENISETFNQLFTQIQALVQTIQLEVQELIVSMEGVIRAVVTCSTLLDRSERAIQEINKNVDQLSELSSEFSILSANSERISEDVVKLSDTMTRSNRTLQTNVKQVSDFANRLNRFLSELSSLTEDLKTSESDFAERRVPSSGE